MITPNRGDKDPDNLISDRIKNYGTSYSVYDIDTADDNTYQITANGLVNKTVEIKRASIDSKGIVHLPYCRPGQLQYLHYNFYASYLAYCIVYRTDQNNKRGEDLFYYLVSPCNHRAAVESNMLSLTRMTEQEFASFLSPTGSLEGTKILLNRSIKEEIKGYRYYTKTGEFRDYSFPEYNSVERILQVANKNKNKQPEFGSWTEKMEIKVRQHFYKEYQNLQEAVLGPTS